MRASAVGGCDAQACSAGAVGCAATGNHGDSADVSHRIDLVGLSISTAGARLMTAASDESPKSYTRSADSCFKPSFAVLDGTVSRLDLGLSSMIKKQLRGMVHVPVT